MQPDVGPAVSAGKRWGASFATGLRERVTIDTRALAAVRISLALVILIDLAHRAPHIELFYSDYGVYPRSAYAESYSQYTGLSIHALSGEVWFQQALFLIAGFVALLFLVGYRTRLVGFTSLILLFSLQARNPAVLNGADRLFLVLILVALVTPIGERWSVDAIRRGSAREHVASFGTAALLIQPLVVFLSNALEKSQGDHWYTGSALQIAMSNDVMTIYLGNVIVDFPILLMLANFVWIVLLAASVLFLFVPTGKLRALFALLYMGAFAGMLVTMTVGLFPLLLITSVIPYLTTPFWDTVASRLPPRITGWRPPLGRFGRPPIERRVLWAIQARHAPLGTAIARTARTMFLIAGLLILVWILLFGSINATVVDTPDRLDYDHLNQQHWGLYAPDPSSGYSWFLHVGNTSDGSTVDVMTGGSPDFDRPPDASAEYETFRHRKFMETVRTSASDTPGTISLTYASWVCEQADPEVESFTLYQVYQPSPVDGEYEDTRRFDRFSYECE